MARIRGDPARNRALGGTEAKQRHSGGGARGPLPPADGMVPRALLLASACGASSRGSDRNASDPASRRQRQGRAGRNVGGARTVGLPPRATAPVGEPPSSERSADRGRPAVSARPEQSEPGLRARSYPVAVTRGSPFPRPGRG